MTYNIEIKKDTHTLVQIDQLRIPDQAITFLFGESGIGKTMLARAIYGLLDTEDFDIRINDQSYPEYLQSPGFQELLRQGFFVFQEPSSHLNPLLKIREQVREGSLAGSGSEADILAGLWPGKFAEELNPILDIYPRPYRPSGGEKQRILMTMAFKKIDLYVQQAGPSSALFIFDEPTGNLDDTHRNIFLSLLIDKFRQQNITILFITHDYSIISELNRNYPGLADRIHYSELQLTGEGLKQKNFSAAQYLEWNRAVKPITRVQKRDSGPLLKLETPIAIYNRELIIYQDHQVKNPVPLEINPGEMVYLKADSGIGKTTLAKCVLGLLRARHMNLQIGDFHFTERTGVHPWRRWIWGHRATMVFQHADEALNLNARVKNVFGGLPLKRKIDDQKLLQYLQWIFSIPLHTGFLDRKVFSLSGGQKQRLNLLRSLILDTGLIVLDEPLNGLDFESIEKIIDLIREKQQEGKGLLLISHNEDIFDRLVPPESIYYLRSQPTGSVS